MDAQNELPNIFAYIDFRKYLEDYYKQRRKTEPIFTHEWICRELGQPNARSYYSNVVRGKKMVSAAFVERFIDLLKLGPAEAGYFRAVVNYNQATTQREREFHFDQVVQLNRTPHSIIDEKTYRFYSEWRHGAIRCLLDIMDFKGDFKALAGRLRPRITNSQAKQSIDLLLKLGLIAPDKNGALKPTEKVLATPPCVKDSLVMRHQAECFSMGKEAIFDTARDPKRTITSTLSVSDQGYARILRRIEQCKSEIFSIVHKDEQKANRVYQIIMQIFPETV